METTATTGRHFRFPDAAVEKLDAIVKAFESETGRRENRTSVLLQLIEKEYRKRLVTYKKGKPQ
jgi:hypothetical protein